MLRKDLKNQYVFGWGQGQSLAVQIQHGKLVGQLFCRRELEGHRVKVSQQCGSDTKKPNKVAGCINGRVVSAASHTISLVNISRIPGRIVTPVWAPLRKLWTDQGIFRESNEDGQKQGKNRAYLERLTNYFAQRTPDSGVLSVCKYRKDGCKEDRICLSRFEWRGLEIPGLN